MKLIPVVTTLVTLCHLAVFSPAIAKQPEEKKKILFIAGKPSHRSGDHEFRAGCMLLADKLNQSGLPLEAKVHFYGWPKDESIFDGVDACVVYADAGGRFGEKYEFLNNKVKEDGMGIMFMHYGVHPEKEVGEKYFKPWIGAYMDDHISVNPHWIADVKPVVKEHISRGVTPFTAYDEFYFNMDWPTKEECVCCRPVAVATPTPDRIVRYINMWNKHGEECFGTEQALMWCRDPKVEDGGRGIGFVGGHYHRNWAIDDFRKLVMNAIVWSARMEVPPEGVHAGKVTEKELNQNLDKKRGGIKFIPLPDGSLLKQKAMAQPKLGDKGKHRNAPKPASKKPAKNEASKAVPTVNAKELAKSRVIKASDKDRSQKLTAEVKGIKALTVYADHVDKKDFDWVALVDVKFIDAEGRETFVEKKHILQSEQQYGKLGIDKNVEGNSIVVNGRKAEKGLGSHGAASIGISVPKEAVKFSLTVALDDGGAIRDGKPTAASVQFSILNENVPLKELAQRFRPAPKKTPASKKTGYRNAKGEFEPQQSPELVEVEHFTTPKDKELEVTLWASTPMLYNPTNMDVDHKGRIWVAEGVNYRRAAGRRRAEGDRIIVLEDTNNDGKADRSTVFLQNQSLECPLGVTVFDNKVFVPQPPNLMVYTDVNRDLKFDPEVDKKEVLLTGFNAAQHDHSLHSVSAGPDGKLYFNNGNCGAIFKDNSGKTFNMNGVYRGGGGRWYVNHHKLGGKKSDDGFLWTSGFTVRMNEDGTDAEIVGHGYRNSYEQAVNSFCDMYQNDNDDHSSCRNSYILEYGSAGYFTRDGQKKYQSRPGEKIPSAHWRQLDPGTFDAGDVYGIGSPTGNTFYENGALGDQWVGTYLACEPGQNAVFGYQPKPKGGGFSMDRFDFVTSNAAKVFLGGDKTKKLRSMGDASNKGVLFRPSDISIGPDGAVYIVDWYDGRVGGHSTMDNSCSGAIYRIAPKGFVSKIPQLDLATAEGQIAALKSPAVNTRYLGFKALKQKGDEVFNEVLAVTKEANKYVAARGIWLLAQLGEKGKSAVVEMLDSSDPEVRLVAFRALRRSGANVVPYAAELADDPDVHVRRDVALGLRHYDAEETKDIFVSLAKKIDPTDKNSVEAIGLGAENKEDAIWLHLKEHLAIEGVSEWSPAFAKLTWRLWASAAVPDLKARALDETLMKEERLLAVESLAFVNSANAAQAMIEVASKDTDVAKTAKYWAQRQGTAEWAKFGIQEALKQGGVYDPDKVVNTSVTVPEESKERKVNVADVMKLTGDAATGKATIMRCVMCHQVNGIGPDYGPALKGWGTAQAREAIIKSIVEPSADIAHGFAGTEIVLTDGKVIHGLFTPGDPASIKSTGGTTQLLPKKKIQKQSAMKRSLMLSADQLGLSPQDVADIAAYMQSWK